MGKIPSKKKKRSRDSSRRKKKRETKSKKILRRNDSSDDSESSSTESSSCSSSEDDYRRRKRRSKGRRKRLRRRESSSESDDDTRRLKKKKRSERKDDYAEKKRTRLRKRRRRDVSSASSESRSESSSGSSGESEGGRKIRRSERRDEDRARLDEVKAKRRRNNDESRSCSSCGQDGELDGYEQEVRDEVTSEKSSRRLRSVIVVPTTPNDDERNSDMDYERDDYLRFRGTDSIDGAYKGELERFGVSQENKTMEEEKYGEPMISSPRTGADEGGNVNTRYDEFGEDNEMETNQATDPDNKLKGDDLETILRMRALENLRRFRGGTHRNGVASQETSSAAEGDSQCIESSKVQESLGHGLVEQKPGISAGSRDFDNSDKTFQEAEYHKESGSLSHDITYPQGQSADTAKEKVDGVLSSCNTRPKLNRPVRKREIANLPRGKQTAGMQDAPTELPNEGTINEDCPESSQTLGLQGSENVEPEGNSTPNVQSSCAETEVGSIGSDKPQDETKEGGFEEKTMSVMRGGEMVQVSYKVYIPKKTPALARRKIKR